MESTIDSILKLKYSINNYQNILSKQKTKSKEDNRYKKFNGRNPIMKYATFSQICQKLHGESSLKGGLTYAN